MQEEKKCQGKGTKKQRIMCKKTTSIKNKKKTDRQERKDRTKKTETDENFQTGK